MEWKGERYAGLQQEIPTRCILGDVKDLSGGENVYVKMGKSSTARKWEAVFVRTVPDCTPSPCSSSKKRQEQSLDSQTSKRIKAAVEPKPTSLHQKKSAVLKDDSVS